MRQIVLDTETTGLEPQEGHRIIEVGCVELVNRRLTHNRFHYYINPERDIDEGAIEVHGLTPQFLADKPRFAEIAQDLLEYLRGAELIIHNAPFDVGFLDAEYTRLDKRWTGLRDICQVTDTLQMARKLHPGQKNNLDALCKRYSVDNSQRELHGALLDAEILAEVYLMMTGGQTALVLGDSQDATQNNRIETHNELRKDRPPLRVIRASDTELAAHEQRLQAIDKACGAESAWRKVAKEEAN